MQESIERHSEIHVEKEEVVGGKHSLERGRVVRFLS